MSDHDPKKTLSEISHLFLSSIRDKQTNGSPRPQRTPPQPSVPSPAPIAVPPKQSQGLPKREPGGPWSGMNIDLTPAELAQVGPEVEASQADATPPVERKSALVTAVIAVHLNGKQFDRVKEYARHLAGQVGRVGLIELDASEFRLMCFEPGATPGDLADAAAATARQPEC